jgi:hypothetical protein
MKSEFWKIDYSELAMDILLIAYSIAFSGFFSESTEAFLHLSASSVFIFFVVLSMFLPWYMGMIYARYRILYNKYIAFIPLLVILLVLIFMLVFLFALNNEAIKFYGITTEASAVYNISTVLLLFYIARAFYVGYKTEKDALQGNSFNVENEEHLRFFFLSFGLSAAFVFCIMYFAQIENGFRDVFNSFLVIGIALISGLLLAFFAIKMLTRLQAAIPIFIITLLICWNTVIEGSITWAMKIATGEVDRDVLIILLSFMGLIPFRFILLFSPPLRAVNLAAGIIALCCYFYFLGR